MKEAEQPMNMRRCAQRSSSVCRHRPPTSATHLSGAEGRAGAVAADGVCAGSAPTGVMPWAPCRPPVSDVGRPSCAGPVTARRPRRIWPPTAPALQALFGSRQNILPNMTSPVGWHHTPPNGRVFWPNNTEYSPACSGGRVRRMWNPLCGEWKREKK